MARSRAGGADGRSTCEGCGLVLPLQDGPTHPYFAASSECWALFGEVLAREFGDREYFRLHQLTVDAYAVQHSRGSDRRAIQSVALHLITLCVVLEHGVDPRLGPRLHKRLADGASFQPLEPPETTGRMTVADVHGARTPADHERLVDAWARDVWAAWEPHHATVRDWVEHVLPHYVTQRLRHPRGDPPHGRS